MNIWTGDGFKDIPADRMGPRQRYKASMDEILSEPYDFSKVKPCIESKVFGIGVEAYTVGSAEFSLTYAAMNKEKCIPLMDNGHYHPTEVVSDKIPAPSAAAAWTAGSTSRWTTLTPPSTALPRGRWASAVCRRHCCGHC